MEGGLTHRRPPRFSERDAARGHLPLCGRCPLAVWAGPREKGGGYFFFCSLAQLSLRPMVRLNTRWPAVAESGSTQK